MDEHKNLTDGENEAVVSSEGIIDPFSEDDRETRSLDAAAEALQAEAQQLLAVVEQNKVLRDAWNKLAYVVKELQDWHDGYQQHLPEIPEEQMRNILLSAPTFLMVAPKNTITELEIPSTNQ